MSQFGDSRIDDLLCYGRFDKCQLASLVLAGIVGYSDFAAGKVS